jgi:VWFA-related protein
MTTRTRLALVLSMLFAAAAFGQTKESITVHYVEVPVNVIDRAGEPVRGLTAANFEILDEGKKREIASFDAIDFASRQSINAVSPLNPAARRNFLILFDLTFSAPASVRRGQLAAREFIAKQVQKRDLVAVATVDAEKSFQLLTAFTTDRALVNSAIADPRAFHASDPLQIASSIPWKEEPANSGNEKDDQAAEEMNDMLRRNAKMEEQYKRQKAERQIGLLAGVARTLSSVHGQKHVVFLSEGFDPKLVQGRDVTSNLGEQMAENQSIERGEIWNVDTDARYGNSGSLSVLRKMGEAFKRSDVFLHAIDIKGLRVASDAREGNVGKSNEALYLLSSSTGGQVLKNANDLSADFTRLLKQQEVVYVLGFNAPSSQAGKFHNLKVRLVGVPGGARATHRAGYYESGAESGAERTLSTAEIIVNDLPQNGIRFGALVTSFPTSSENAQVPVILEVNGADLLKAAKSAAGLNAEVFIYAFDEEGIVRDSLYQRLGLDLAKVGDQLRATGFKYYATLSLPPGSYAIKTLVRVPESDTRGFVRRDLVVARPGDVALSQPIFFDNGPSWLMIKGASHDKTSAPYPFEIDGKSFIPSTSAHGGGAAPRNFAVFVYNASPDEMTLETRPAAKLVSQFKSANGSKVIFELPPSPQQASVSVTMRKKGSSDERTTTAPLD